jgi:hypothetical protein
MYLFDFRERARTETFELSFDTYAKAQLALVVTFHSIKKLGCTLI